ncbi:MAG TPA: hypothetical protein VNN17_11810, partial [Terriglobia bacterium]|nr:hypothetical protein [Terriglobia bacterium]
MTRPEMLLRLVRKALWVRPGKLALSVLALTVGATLSSAFLSLYFDLPAKMSAEFRTLGPNLIVAPRGAENTFSAQLEDRLATAYPALARLPWLYAVGQAGDRNVVLAGSRLEDLAAMHPSWRGIPSHPGEGLLAGETAAALLGWKIGETHRISYAGRQINLPLAGIVSTGGSEDSQLLLPLATLQ